MTEMDYVNSYLEEIVITSSKVEQAIQKLEKRMKQSDTIS